MNDFSKQCRDLRQLAPVTQIACNLFLEECEKQGVDVFITETYRSQERQNYLYEQGRTRPGNIVTWTRRSNHTGRMAWDIACSPPNYLYDKEVLRMAGNIAESLGITWGGSWSTPDMPHFEVTNLWKAPEKEECNLEKRYNTIEELPAWGVETITKLVQEKKIADKNHLDLSHDMLRLLVIMNR